MSRSSGCTRIGSSLIGTAMLVSMALASFPAAAQPFPSKVVRLVVPYPPGGSVDVVARTIQQPLARALGQNVIVENRPGANAAIGSGACRWCVRRRAYGSRRYSQYPMRLFGRRCPTICSGISRLSSASGPSLTCCRCIRQGPDEERQGTGRAGPCASKRAPCTGSTCTEADSTFGEG